jgi:hypothetical protein
MLTEEERVEKIREALNTSFEVKTVRPPRRPLKWYEKLVIVISIAAVVFVVYGIRTQCPNVAVYQYCEPK